WLDGQVHQLHDLETRFARVKYRHIAAEHGGDPLREQRLAVTRRYEEEERLTRLDRPPPHICEFLADNHPFEGRLHSISKDVRFIGGLHIQHFNIFRKWHRARAYI